MAVARTSLPGSTSFEKLAWACSRARPSESRKVLAACGSRSYNKVRGADNVAEAQARLTARGVLPTPPFRL